LSFREAFNIGKAKQNIDDSHGRVIFHFSFLDRITHIEFNVTE